MSNLNYTAVNIREDDDNNSIPLTNVTTKNRPKRGSYSKSKIVDESGLQLDSKMQEQIFLVAKNPFFMMTFLAGILVLIVMASITFNSYDSAEFKIEVLRQPLNPLTLEDVGWALTPSYGKIRWIKSEDEHDGTYSKLDVDLNIVLVHVDNVNTTVLARAEDIRDLNGKVMPITDYSISSDLQYLLLETNHEKGWRHSYFANYHLFNVRTKVTVPLTTSMPNKEIPEEIGQGKVALTIWSPVGHTVAWIRDNDLYVTIDGDKEYQITNDGSKTIINGIADWVYEEEVYGGNVAMWFSPDASRLAFLKFNESSVPDYRVEYYMNGANPYPREVTIKYPKAGAPNPIATLHIASPYAEKVEHRSLPVIFNENENFADENRLIVEVDWLSSDELLVRLMNRVQDYQRVFIASPRTEENGNSVSWVARMIRDEQSTDGAWYNVLQAAKVIPPSNSRNYSSYIEMAENAHGYMHIAYYRSIEESKPTMWLTSGSFEVTEILSVDVETDLIYFTSTEEGSTQRHLYSVQLDGSEKMKLTPPKNMTLRQPFRTYNKTTSEKSDDELGYYSAQFSPKSKYFILKYMGPGVPFSKIYRTADKEPVGVLSMNDPIHEALLKKDLPLQGIITLPNDNGDEMNTKMMFPPDFDINKKYPVLMKVYGGPSSQSVSHAFSVDFMAAVAGSMGFVSVIVDGRGTGAKGRKFRSSVSKNLGFYEALDQITAAKKIAAMPFVDLNRIAIWGWSYGGYTTLKTLEANSGVFALGMAVAPVTNWKYYDSVYTERYMKTPQINPLGYEESSVRKMDGFKQSKLLLIHGTADDNVHFQNTAALIWKLTGEAVRNYQVQVFTDSDHSIYENGAHAEVYDLMRRYLIENFVDNKLNSTIKRSQIASLIEPVSNSKR